MVAGADVDLRAAAGNAPPGRAGPRPVRPGRRRRRGHRHRHHHRQVPRHHHRSSGSGPRPATSTWPSTGSRRSSRPWWPRGRATSSCSPAPPGPVPSPGYPPIRPPGPGPTPWCGRWVRSTPRDGLCINAIGTNFMDFPGFLAASGADTRPRTAQPHRGPDTGPPPRDHGRAGGVQRRAARGEDPIPDRAVLQLQRRMERLKRSGRRSVHIVSSRSRCRLDGHLLCRITMCMFCDTLVR